MSFASQILLINPNSRISFHLTTTHFTPLKTPQFSLSVPSKYFSNPPNLQIPNIKRSNSNNFISLRTQHWSLTALKSDGTVPKPDWVFDSFLPVYELLILFPLTVVSIGISLNSSSQKPIVAWLGNKIHPWHFAILVSAVMVGYSVRMWQWRQICMYFSNPGDSGVNLLQRTEKLEEDLRSTATIIRVLSRQLEKLGIRFRVTRKALKEPIAETAALAQKNSEATRALAAQEDNLEKELGEIQKVLLAMQEQQQKQLELIIAISKTGKLWESRREHVQDPEKVETRNSAVKVVNQIETNQIQAFARQKEANNDRA